MPVTLTGTASAIGSRAAPTISAPAGADVPSAASNNQPDQGLLNLVASLLAHGGLLDVSNTYSQAQIFNAITTFNALATFNAGISAPAPALHLMGTAGSTFQNGCTQPTTGSGSDKFLWWVDTLNNVLHIQGTIIIPNGLGSNQPLVANIPAPYRPSGSGTIIRYCMDLGANIRNANYDTNGNLFIHTSGSGVGGTFFCDISIRLDHPLA